MIPLVGLDYFSELTLGDFEVVVEGDDGRAVLVVPEVDTTDTEAELVIVVLHEASAKDILHKEVEEVDRAVNLKSGANTIVEIFHDFSRMVGFPIRYLVIFNSSTLVPLPDI